MIGRLKGVLEIKKAPQILIDCQGVGYNVDVSMTTYYQLPEQGSPVCVWTHLLIKDDSHSLIGFAREQERKLFRLLIRINGVGAKMALTILSGMSEIELAHCVQHDDIVTLTRLPGVGKKTAERLIIELRDKITDLLGDGQETSDNISQKTGGTAVAEAVEALKTLGYREQEAVSMIKKLAADEGVDAQWLIKKALQASVSGR